MSWSYCSRAVPLSCAWRAATSPYLLLSLAFYFNLSLSEESKRALPPVPVSTRMTAEARSSNLTFLAQHCQRYNAMLIAVTLIGDSLVHKMLFTKSAAWHSVKMGVDGKAPGRAKGLGAQSTDAYPFPAKEIIAIARTFGSSSDSTAVPSLAALSLYLHSLTLLRHLLETTLRVRMSEQPNSQFLNPLDNLIQVRFSGRGPVKSRRTLGPSLCVACYLAHRSAKLDRSCYECISNLSEVYSLNKIRAHRFHTLSVFMWSC